MKRNPSPKIILRNQHVIKRIKELKAIHPFWGYRRIWAHLKYIDGIPINKKRVLRLMRVSELLVKANMRNKANRTINTKKPRPVHPNEWWGIDMTKVMIENYGWIYIVIVLDWFTKKILGYYVGDPCKAIHWLDALNMAANKQFPNGVRDQGVQLMNDNGSQPTSIRFMSDCSVLGIKQAFTSYNNPKGNADTERMMRTMKEELFWLKEWASPFELGKEFTAWVEYYNSSYLHSALGYKSPEQFEKQYFDSHKTLLVHA
jgi:transposase InsO family protein